MVGTFLIITKCDVNSLSISKLALFWGICSGFAAALYTLQPANLLNKYSSVTIVGWGMLIGGIAFSFINPPWKFSGIWSLPTVACVGFVVIFGTLVAYYCYLESLNYILPTEASITEISKVMGSSRQNVKQIALKLENKVFVEIKKG